MRYSRFLAIMTIVTSVLAAGCTTVPLPKYAKSNDFVTVPLGGTKTVGNGNYLTNADVQVTIVDGLGQEFPASIYNLFRVYADPSSRYALAGQDAGSQLNSYTYPNEGQWMVTFIMPSGNQMGQTPEPGAATIRIESTEQTPDPDPKLRRMNTDPRLLNEDLANLTFEILPGTGGTLGSEVYGAQYLVASPTVLAAPDDASMLVNNVGGAVIVFEYDNTVFIPEGLPYAVKNSPDQQLQLTTKREDAGNGKTRLTAILINPNGFFDDQSWVPGASYYDALNIAFSWDEAAYFGNGVITDQNWQTYITVIANESYYIDLDGNQVPNVTPVLTKVR